MNIFHRPKVITVSDYMEKADSVAKLDLKLD